MKQAGEINYKSARKALQNRVEKCGPRSDPRQSENTAQSYSVQHSQKARKAARKTNKAKYMRADKSTYINSAYVLSLGDQIME